MTSLSPKAVGKIFSGLCQCGAWGCFDEFNRIDVSVLSVISTQLTTIRNALLMDLKKFHVRQLEISICQWNTCIQNSIMITHMVDLQSFGVCSYVCCIMHSQFEGQEIEMDSRVGIFITMNPGYAGRTELPESVKALFRPVVVIVPDLQQICEIMLFSEGFLHAKVR